jgi:hypothetical protein
MPKMSNSSVSPADLLLPSLSFEAASRAFAVANTPLFLLRKIQTDEVVHILCERLTPTELFVEIKRRVRRRPQKIEDAVIPYVLVCALAKNGRDLLPKVEVLRQQHFPWLPILAGYLDATVTPTTRSRHTIHIARIEGERPVPLGDSAVSPAS